MKRVGHIYEKMCSYEICRKAILNAADGKKKRKEVQVVLNDLDTYARRLQQIMVNESYSPAPYSPFEKLDARSGKVRRIQRPRFWPDQAVHWLMVIWEKTKRLYTGREKSFLHTLRAWV